VTVELALAMPAVAVLLALALGALRLTVDAAVAHDAAATAARVAMVDGAPGGVQAGEQASRGRATVTVVQDGEWWVAVAQVDAPGPWPDARATARAWQP
jgi:hypothetical protein